MPKVTVGQRGNKKTPTAHKRVVAVKEYKKAKKTKK